MKQKERRRRTGTGERPSDRGQNSGERQSIEAGRWQCGKVNARSRFQRLTRPAVSGFVATSIGMILGVRGDRAGVSVKGSGTDMAHHHQDGDSYDED